MTEPPSDSHRWKPGVPKTVLILLAGMMWLIVGIFLDRVAYGWLSTEPAAHAVIAAAVGLTSALIIHHFGFLRLVDRNLERILPMSGPRCLFSFMPLKSYLLVAVMIALGAGLRHSAIPRSILAVIYTAIGTALMLSSIRYIRIMFHTIHKQG